jgi:hypothetical protein
MPYGLFRTKSALTPFSLLNLKFIGILTSYIKELFTYFANIGEPKSQEKSKLLPAKPTARPADFSGQRFFD